ncbi:MAG: molecular chaperone HscC [Candidatus Andeanibacterium colombiense]|uniref:Molecular chaperone HscC n=1 Tax=Candidatus Andeanibacterium colombiense TaxID=3121345 RepID=A0AAJ5X880_9SPHN|nr:MAG: molecular chaperone HscC [Sphingomonadaceae bacterium]
MIVGIDLGTTNSAVAYWSKGEPRLVPNSLGHYLTPSAVSLGDDGELLVGLPARERQPTHPERTATAFKRYMGSARKVKLGRKDYTPEDLSALVLASLKRDAEAHLGEAVTGAVITVPAYFNDKQRRATRRAGELAGLKVERLINEPTAAALAFGIHQRELEEPFLVFDLGGGTFDVSLVEMFDGIIEVRASAGDNRLGGEDFNQVLIDCAREQLAGSLPDGGRDAEALHEIMRDAAERTRRALSEAEEATCRFVWQGKEYEFAITAEKFAERAEPLIERLREPVLRSLRDGATKVGQLSEIVLVGGGTRMPVVRKAVTRMFGRFPDTTVHPDHAVALGAAIQAGLKQRNADLDEVRLTDVCPFTLGVGVGERDNQGGIRSGIFSPIIERNTVIPASRVQRYFTMADNQDTLRLEVYQGEGRHVSDNVWLGQLDIPVPRKGAGEVSVDCRFTYDTSGLLEVDVTVPGTEVSRQLLIYDREDSALAANLDARRDALGALKIHPRDQAANAAALARANRCYEGHLGETRDYVGGLIGFFENALTGQDPREIDTARDELTRRLDEVEGEQYL